MIVLLRGFVGRAAGVLRLSIRLFDHKLYDATLSPTGIEVNPFISTPMSVGPSLPLTECPCTNADLYF
jgi:hypothetical protein